MDLAWGIESTCNVIDRETQSIGYTQGLTRIKITYIAIFKKMCYKKNILLRQ